jgi:hypothetical protein
MPSRQRHPSIAQNTVPSVPMTIFHQLPQSHQQQLAHLVADLIRRMYAGKQNREGDHER